MGSLGEIKKIPSSPKIVIKPKERGEFILRCSLKRAQKTRPDFKKHFSKALQIKEDGGKLLIIFDDKCEMFKHLMSEMARILDLTLIAPHFVDKGVEQSAGNDLPPLLADSRSPVVTLEKTDVGRVKAEDDSENHTKKKRKRKMKEIEVVTLDSTDEDQDITEDAEARLSTEKMEE